MSRGLLYYLMDAEKVGVDKDGRLASDDILKTTANEVTEDLHGKDCDWAEETDFSTERNEFNHYITQFDNVTTMLIEADDENLHLKVTFLPRFKKSYFKNRFDVFKKKVAEMTLDDFCKDVNTVKSYMDNTYSDMVVTDDSGYNTFDEFVRSLSDEYPEEYIVSSIVILK